MITDAKYLPVKLNQLKLDLSNYINSLYSEGASYTSIKDALYGIFDELVMASNQELQQLQKELDKELAAQNTKAEETVMETAEEPQQEAVEE